MESITAALAGTSGWAWLVLIVAALLVGFGKTAIGGVVMIAVVLAGAAPLSHNFSPLLDTRPGVPADERYKALGGMRPAMLPRARQAGAHGVAMLSASWAG